MDLRTLRYFQVVAECGSYSRGAELLRISQPAVSRAVRLLEEELGRAVFQRNGHGVTLTDPGRVLLERAQSILRQIDQLKGEITEGDEGPSGTIAIALPPAAGHFLAPALVARMRRDFPAVSLKFVGGFSGYIHEWLIRGHVDVACLHDPPPQRGFETTPLLREEVFLVGKRGSLHSDGPGLPMARLLELPLALPSGMNATRRLLNGWAGANGVWFQPRVEVDDHMITRALIRRGEAFSLLTRGAFADDLAHGEIEAFSLQPPIYWTLTLVTCLRSPRSPLIDVFSQRLIAVTQELRESGVWRAEPV
ncbi:MAG: LysR family transcriptional regulator [Salinarimonadaceae bacterium]|nr:MAG: LysR family transcriptional regulator [Salinarimonadaceae bacterium]